MLDIHPDPHKQCRAPNENAMFTSMMTSVLQTSIAHIHQGITQSPERNVNKRQTLQMINSFTLLVWCVQLGLLTPDELEEMIAMEFGNVHVASHGTPEAGAPQIALIPYALHFLPTGVFKGAPVAHRIPMRLLHRSAHDAWRIVRAPTLHLHACCCLPSPNVHLLLCIFQQRTHAPLPIAPTLSHCSSCRAIQTDWLTD